jgi:hypothetical protein
MFLYNEIDDQTFTNSTTGSYDAAAGVLNSLAQIELVTNGYNVTVVGSDTPQYVYGLFMELTDPADFAAGYTVLDSGTDADFKITTGFQPSAIWACVGHQNAQLGVESANPSAWTNWVLSEQSQVSLSASSDNARSGASAASYYVSTTNWVGLNDGGLETYVSTSAAIETDGVLWADLSRSSFIPSYVPWFSFAAADTLQCLLGRHSDK